MDHGDLLPFIQRRNQISRPLNTKREQKQLSLTPLTYSGRVDILL